MDISLSSVSPTLVIKPPEQPEMSLFDIEDSIIRGLPQELNGRNALLLAPDFTRHSHAFESELLFQMQRLYGQDRVDIAIASGMHRQSSMEDIRLKFGLSVDQCIIYQNNPVQGLSWLARLKEEKNYYVFGLSNPYPHTYMGMSGGYKLVLPGMASAYEAGEFHSIGKNSAIEMQEMIASDFIDFWIGCSHSYTSWPTDTCFTSTKYYFDTWVQRIRDHYKVLLPRELPEIALLEPYVKNIDFIQAMNTLLVAKNRPIVRAGGMIVILCNLPDGMGVHYLFQRGNGTHRHVMYDKVFEKELEGRRIGFLTDSVPRRAIQEFFNRDVYVFKSVNELGEFVWNEYGDDLDIHHYIAPEIIIGE